MPHARCNVKVQRMPTGSDGYVLDRGVDAISRSGKSVNSKSEMVLAESLVFTDNEER